MTSASGLSACHSSLSPRVNVSRRVGEAGRVFRVSWSSSSSLRCTVLMLNLVVSCQVCAISIDGHMNLCISYLSARFRCFCIVSFLPRKAMTCTSLTLLSSSSLPLNYRLTPTRLSFTQGFLVGQLSVVIFVSFFIKFFIFGELPSRRSSGVHLSTLSPTHKRSVSFSPIRGASSPYLISPPRHRRSSSVSSTLSLPAQFSHIIRPPPHLTPAAILHKTYYDVNAHPPESLDWFNVLVAQALAQLRADACADGAILESLTAVLNGPHKPAFCDRIAVTEIALGESFPIFSNCRVHPVSEDEDGDGNEGGGGGSSYGGGGRAGTKARRLLARMDVDLSDALTLGVETTLVLNYPRPNTARLPVALSVSVARFSGTLAISFQPAAHGRHQHPRHHHQRRPSASPHQAPPRPPRTPPPGGPPGWLPGVPTDPAPLPKHTPTTLSFSFSPTYTLALTTRSLLGARARLQDVPKIAQLVEARLRTWFEERCVAPRRQEIAVPSLWPRMHNVVVGGGEPEQSEAERSEREKSELDQREQQDNVEAEAASDVFGVPPSAGTWANASAGAGASAMAQFTADALRRQHEMQRQRQADAEGLRWRGGGGGAPSSFGHEEGGGDWIETGVRMPMPGSMPL
jgi:maintenance of mitochondrial morphology protein 1